MASSFQFLLSTLENKDEDIMAGLSPIKLLILFGIILVLFGGRRLPELATSLGQAIGNFRKALKGEDKDEKASLTAENEK
jgi:sec-independent protein translocase protein TatA